MDTDKKLIGFSAPDYADRWTVGKKRPKFKWLDAGFYPRATRFGNWPDQYGQSVWGYKETAPGCVILASQLYDYGGYLAEKDGKLEVS